MEANEGNVKHLLKHYGFDRGLDVVTKQPSGNYWATPQWRTDPAIAVWAAAESQQETKARLIKLRFIVALVGKPIFRCE
ncbi:hypothetical protein [Nodosilinea sp. E11]|uniref:hypothetical protein n=1 Tax=Nodosilinea sp. E11 TaxID=3037479 RepID=UPI0029344AAB|nr:hypothetical protein [Nodosilinea sp. E11]